MKITLDLEQTLAEFYSRIAARAGLPLSQVLSDALFRLAGSLALEANAKNRENRR